MINPLIKRGLPILPKWVARPFAKTYVAGETSEEALMHVKNINAKGFAATIDILGEHTIDVAETVRVAEQYCELYRKINDQSLDCGISIKPTHLGLMISLDEATGNISAILNQAKAYGNFLRLDMESSRYTDQTLSIYRYCKRRYDHVGVVIQSCLRRSIRDVEVMAANSFNARICKGIYKESNTIAYQGGNEVNDNFLALAKALQVKGAVSAYATHDHDLIDRLVKWIESESIDRSTFEFQTLYGVPMQGRLNEMISNGYRVRIYVPFGADWFEYSMRRLDENPDIARYVIKNMLRKK